MMVAEFPPGVLARTFGCAALSDSGEDVSTSSDALAMGRLAHGEIDALGELYDRHQAAIRRFATRMTGSSDEGDDLVHATFLAALRTAGAFDGRRSCRAWLLGITAQLIRRQRSTFARWARLLGGFRHAEPSSLRDPEGALSAREGIERGLARLSDEKRSVLLMAEVEGLSGDEIAQALAIPVGTVWTRLHYARRELLALLSEEPRP